MLEAFSNFIDNITKNEATTESKFKSLVSLVHEVNKMGENLKNEFFKVEAELKFTSEEEGDLKKIKSQFLASDDLPTILVRLSKNPKLRKTYLFLLSKEKLIDYIKNKIKIIEGNDLSQCEIQLNIYKIIFYSYEGCVYENCKFNYESKIIQILDLTDLKNSTTKLLKLFEDKLLQEKKDQYIQSVLLYVFSEYTLFTLSALLSSYMMLNKNQKFDLVTFKEYSQSPYGLALTLPLIHLGANKLGLINNSEFINDLSLYGGLGALLLNVGLPFIYNKGISNMYCGSVPLLVIAVLIPHFIIEDLVDKQQFKSKDWPTLPSL